MMHASTFALLTLGASAQAPPDMPAGPEMPACGTGATVTCCDDPSGAIQDSFMFLMHGVAVMPDSDSEAPDPEGVAWLQNGGQDCMTCSQNLAMAAEVAAQQEMTAAMQAGQMQAPQRGELADHAAMALKSMLPIFGCTSGKVLSFDEVMALTTVPCAGGAAKLAEFATDFQTMKTNMLAVMNSEDGDTMAPIVELGAKYGGKCFGCAMGITDKVAATTDPTDRTQDGVKGAEKCFGSGATGLAPEAGAPVYVDPAAAGARDGDNAGSVVAFTAIATAFLATAFMW